VDVYKNLAFYYLFMGRREQAQASLQQARSIDPKLEHLSEYFAFLPVEGLPSTEQILP